MSENTEVKKPKDLDLLNKMKKLPGGLVIIPLVIAVLLATFCPQVYQVGGYVTALFYDGNSCMMGFFLIVCGSAINIKQVGMPLYKGVTLTATKFLLGVIIGMLVSAICGPEGFLGIAPFVWIATITNSNGSLYISLSAQFGNATDTGAISILSLNDGPFFTLIALGATGLASIPIDSLIAVLVPLLIGFIWGNLDAGFRKACATAQPIVTFFMTISIGAKTDVNTIITAGAGSELCHDTCGSRRGRPGYGSVRRYGYSTVRDSIRCYPVPLPVHHSILRQTDAEETAWHLLTGGLGTLQG